MDYFKILNLSREPFSNSPEPELFFQSNGHVACLQQLELAIRLHRGLNVVMGEVGTGKTTLCRQLILRLSESEEDRQDIETHLLLDPSFSTPEEFLVTVAAGFGLPAGQAGTESLWQMKEGIKNYLFQKGVDEQKTVLLIIDEGQKLPDFCREILREFLNYETNEKKLLQIVIFAQNEFREILKGHKNFADRVNRIYPLRALDFAGTRGMVRFRLDQAAHPAKGPRLFTLPALWAIYRATGGYPRRVITLCHHVLLTMIIRNRTRAGWFLVRSTERRLRPPAPPVPAPKLWRPATTALATALLLTLIAFRYLPAPQGSIRNDPSSIETMPVTVAIAETAPPPARTAAAAETKPLPPVATTTQALLSPVKPVSARPAPQQQEPAKAASPVGAASVARLPVAKPDPDRPLPAASAVVPPLKVSAGVPDSGATIPARLGELKSDGGDPLRLLLEVYGRNRAVDLRAVAAVNPHIPDINRIPAGERVALPAIPASPAPLVPEKTWVQMARKRTLEEAYRLLKAYPPDLPPVRLLPSWHPREGLAFAIVLREGFAGVKEAGRALDHLPTGAKIMPRPERGTVFFAN